jgi:zinc protease
VPLVTVRLEIPGGRMVEPPELPGLAHLSADLLETGPQGTAPEEWRRSTENLAADIDCQARLDHWSLGFRCLSEDLDAAAALLTGLLAAPGLHGPEWRRLVKARRAEAREGWNQPASVLHRLGAVQALGFSHPGAHPPFEKSYAHAPLEAARNTMLSALRRGPGMRAAIGGDIDAEAGLGLLRRILSALPEGTAALPVEPPPAPSSRPVWIMDHRGIDQVFFSLTRASLRAGDPDRVALRLANYLIGGGGFESRLMDRVREKVGGTYGISSTCPEDAVARPFAVNSYTRFERLGDMLGIVEKTLSEIAESGFTPEELAAAAGNRHGSLPLKLSDPGVVLRRALEGRRAGLTPEELDRDWEAYLATPLEAVNAAARRLIGDRQFRLAAVGPAERIRPVLERIGPVEVFGFRTTPDRWPG